MPRARAAVAARNCQTTKKISEATGGSPGRSTTSGSLARSGRGGGVAPAHEASNTTRYQWKKAARWDQLAAATTAAATDARGHPRQRPAPPVGHAPFAVDESPGVEEEVGVGRMKCRRGR